MSAESNLFELCRVQPTFLQKNINALLINEGLAQSERLVKLNNIAIHQIKLLSEIEDKKYMKA